MVYIVLAVSAVSFAVACFLSYKYGRKVEAEAAALKASAQAEVVKVEAEAKKVEAEVKSDVQAVESKL